MSLASAYSPTSAPLIYKSSSSTVALPPTAMVGFGSVSKAHAGRSTLLLGADLLAVDPLFKDFFQELKSLQEDQDEDAPPDPKSLAEVLRLVPFSRNQLAQKWFTPRISSDGFGGVRLTWQRGQREVRAVISGSETERSSYLYWEDGDAYETIPNFTATTLYTFLYRLENA